MNSVPFSFRTHATLALAVDCPRFPFCSRFCGWLAGDGKTYTPLSLFLRLGFSWTESLFSLPRSQPTERRQQAKLAANGEVGGIEALSPLSPFQGVTERTPLSHAQARLDQNKKEAAPWGRPGGARGDVVLVVPVSLAVVRNGLGQAVKKLLERTCARDPSFVRLRLVMKSFGDSECEEGCHFFDLRTESF